MPSQRFKQWGLTIEDVVLTVQRHDESDGDEPRVEFTTIAIQGSASRSVVTTRTSDHVFSSQGLHAGVATVARKVGRHLHPFTPGPIRTGLVVRLWENDRSLERDREANQRIWNDAIQQEVSRQLTRVAGIVGAIPDIDFLSIVPEDDLERSFRNDDDLVGADSNLGGVGFVDSSERGIALGSYLPFEFTIAAADTASVYAVAGRVTLNRADVVVDSP